MTNGQWTKLSRSLSFPVRWMAVIAVLTAKRLWWSTWELTQVSDPISVRNVTLALRNTVRCRSTFGVFMRRTNHINVMTVVGPSHRSAIWFGTNAYIQVRSHTNVHCVKRLLPLAAIYLSTCRNTRMTRWNLAALCAVSRLSIRQASGSTSSRPGIKRCQIRTRWSSRTQIVTCLLYRSYPTPRYKFRKI